MHAIICEQYGGPEVLELADEIPIPQPGPKPLRRTPAEGRRGRGKVCGDKCARGQTASAQSAAGVKSKPAYPQQTGADKAEHHAMWRHILLRVPDSASEIQSAYQGGNS